MASSVFIWPGLFTNNGTTINPLLPIAFPDGAVGAPSITFALDTDTGFYRSGANQMIWVTGGGILLIGDANLTVGAGVGLIWSTDNGTDIGASGASRPRTGYFGTSVVTPTVNATAGTYQAAGAAFPTATVAPSSPTGTTSTTLVMAGLAGAITTQTGRVVISMSGYLTDNTANDGTKCQISYGTGTAPINGAALTGTQVGPVVQYNASTLAAGASAPYAATWVVTGLTKNTAYWFDTAFAAITGGTGSLVQAAMIAYDIP